MRTFIEEIKNIHKTLDKFELNLTQQIKSVKNKVLMWLFIFWISQMLAFLGIVFFVFRALNI